MTDAILTHDAGVSAFDTAGGVVQSTDDDGVEFSWDEDNIVRVDAPANLKGAFDTDRFYKIEGATVARPIKQPYLVGDEIKWYKKPADELDKAAWSFDNAPFTLGHPETGMVKNVDDIHGFWRSPRYDRDEDRLLEDLYVPVSDDEAMKFIEENGDVSVGFYNRIHSNYTGDTGDLSDDDNLDGFQVDMFGNHIAGVERGRCSSEHGCGLDGADHGTVVAAGPQDTHRTMTDEPDYDIAPSVDEGVDITTDYTNSEGRYFAVSPEEGGGEPKFPINSCSDVEDAWFFAIRERGDINISFDTLKNRIQQKAADLGCEVPSESEESEDAADCNCTPDQDDSNMSDTDTSTDSPPAIPDLSVDALAERNEAIQAVVDERDSLRADLDEYREFEEDVEAALDSAENFTIELDDDECLCDAVETLVADLDAKVEEVEDLESALSEYREEEVQERLDRLEDLGADREDWAETADEADDPIEALDEEIQRREEVLDSAGKDTSVKDIGSSTDEEETTDDVKRTMSGTRTFGRGQHA